MHLVSAQDWMTPVRIGIVGTFRFRFVAVILDTRQKTTAYGTVMENYGINLLYGSRFIKI